MRNLEEIKKETSEIIEKQKNIESIKRELLRDFRKIKFDNPFLRALEAEQFCDFDLYSNWIEHYAFDGVDLMDYELVFYWEKYEKFPILERFIEISTGYFESLQELGLQPDSADWRNNEELLELFRKNMYSNRFCNVYPENPFEAYENLLDQILEKGYTHISCDW